MLTLLSEGCSCPMMTNVDEVNFFLAHLGSSNLRLYGTPATFWKMDGNAPRNQPATSSVPQLSTTTSGRSNKGLSPFLLWPGAEDCASASACSLSPVAADFFSWPVAVVPDRTCLVVNFWGVQQRFVVFPSLACGRRLRLRERLLICVTVTSY